MRVVSTMTTVEWLPVGGPTSTRTCYRPRRTYPMRKRWRATMQRASTCRLP